MKTHKNSALRPHPNQIKTQVVLSLISSIRRQVEQSKRTGACPEQIVGKVLRNVSTVQLPYTANIDLTQLPVAKENIPKAEKKVDFLYMNPIERNQYWVEKRQENLHKLKEEQIERELYGCTFSPRLNKQTKSSPLRESLQLKSVPSYTDLFKNRKELREESNKTPRNNNYLIKERPTLKTTENNYCCYNGPLSPYPLEVRYKEGFNSKAFQKQTSSKKKRNR